ncbi:MAG: hypothetical protein KIT16_07125 [Rhodospirillaceae bacterium]|nr:hypothetical protein [Rhodospirillaceae bacterium]
MIDGQVGSRARTIAATFDALAGRSVRDLAWPAPFAAIVGPLRGIYRRYLDEVVAERDPEVRSVMLLGRRSMPILALTQYAIWTEAARQMGARLEGHAALHYLAGDGGAAPPPLQPITQPPVGSRWRWARRIARTQSWTPAWRLPRAMLRPDGIALTHNALLRRYLSNSPFAVRNAYDEDFLLATEPKDEAFLRRIEPRPLAQRLANAITGETPVGAETRVLLATAVQAILEQAFVESADLLARLRMRRRLPSRIFTGTGSKSMSCALGIEIMRRGGEAVRCDHGGSFVLLDAPYVVGLNELAASSRFVVATPLAAESEGLRNGLRSAAAISACTLEGHGGDPGLDVGTAAFVRTPQARPGRRRAMYVSTVFYGMHQVSPPVMPAPLYLNWQLRLAAMLRAMPVDLVLKPHPGGLRPPPGLDPARESRAVAARFEQAVAEADVLIYDFPATTTLAIGMCTDRPIVLIDHGTMNFSPSLAGAVAARCRRVMASYDALNRPIVDPAVLEEAVCGGADTADPSFFRRLFLGSA